MRDNELKPCPFCKNDNSDFMSIPFDSRYGDKVKYVACKLCHAQGPWTVTEEKAIAAWNRRVQNDKN
jgi:Lar family restriction alleviation protein